MRRTALLAAAVALAASAGCGGATSASRPAPPSAAPPVLPASALPRMHATATTLAAGALAQATPIAGLDARLRAWGVRGAAAREFTAVGGPLDHVVARTAVFGDAAGAAAYVRTLVARRDAYLGDGATLRAMRGGWLIRQPACGCHPQPPTLIALLRDGARVRWLSLSGSGADAARARALATHLP